MCHTFFDNFIDETVFFLYDDRTRVNYTFPERIQNMKKVKQILAILGIIVLVGLYVSTIICALSASDNFMNMLMTSIYASVIIPVLIWAYSFIYKLIKKDSEEKNTTDN